MFKTPARLVLSLMLPLSLYACGTSPTFGTPPPSSAATYGDGLDHTWTATAAEGQQLYTALSHGLTVQDLNIGLSITATNGWGPIELNTSNGETAAGDGHPITLKGKVYPTGLGVHADSEIHIKATGLVTPACTHFTADIGIDDEVGANGQYSSVVFQVFADGEKLYDSGLVTGRTPTKSIDVAIGNKSDLRFVVTKGLDRNYFDHADWAGASLACAVPALPPSLTLDTSSLNIYHKHTGTLHATFHNYPAGTTAIQLTPDPFVQPPMSALQLYPLLQLDTTTVMLTGAASETHDIVISAPDEGVGLGVARNTFHLTTSHGVTDIDSVPVYLKELPLTFTFSFSPSVLTAHAGETTTTILTVSIFPPVSFTPILSANPYVPFPPDFSLISVGATTGNGASVSVPITVKFMAASAPTSASVDLFMSLSAIGGGYRDYFYYNAPSLLRTNLNLQQLP